MLGIKIDRPTDPHGVHLSELLVSFDLVQHVAESTHDRGGILDLVITKSDDKASSPVVDWNGISDHAQVEFSIEAAKPAELRLEITARTWKSFNEDLFVSDLANSDVCQSANTLDSVSLDDVCDM